MPNFKPDNIHQRTFLDVDFLEVLGDNSFEYCLYLLLERKGMLSALEATYKNDHGGRPAYEPKMLLRVILYAYYRGITSSRVIAASCRTDLKFMALAGGEVRTSPQSLTLSVVNQMPWRMFSLVYSWCVTRVI